jgi:Ner family transcriptional regulator
MHKEDIKAALHKKGVTLAQLSRDNGYSQRAAQVSLTKPWPQVNIMIAKALGLSLHQIWPQWYDVKGNILPRHQRGKPNSTPIHKKRHCKKSTLKLTENGNGQ